MTWPRTFLGRGLTDHVARQSPRSRPRRVPPRATAGWRRGRGGSRWRSRWSTTPRRHRPSAGFDEIRPTTTPRRHRATRRGDTRPPTADPAAGSSTENRRIVTPRHRGSPRGHSPRRQRHGPAGRVQPGASSGSGWSTPRRRPTPYLVSGSVTHNLAAGHLLGVLHAPLGRRRRRLRRHAVLRAVHPGPTGAAIGFHTHPDEERRTAADRGPLGTPQSHGCIRQRMPDAIALWDYAPDGTEVVVVA